MLMIRPPRPAAAMWRAAAWVARNGAVTLTASVSSKSSRLSDSNGAIFVVTAALLTRMSIRPSRSTAASTTRGGEARIGGEVGLLRSRRGGPWPGSPPRRASSDAALLR